MSVCDHVTAGRAAVMHRVAGYLSTREAARIGEIRMHLSDIDEDRLGKTLQTLKFWNLAEYDFSARLWRMTADETHWREEIARRTVVREMPDDARERSKAAAEIRRRVVHRLEKGGEHTADELTELVGLAVEKDCLDYLISKRKVTAGMKNGVRVYRKAVPPAVIDEITRGMALCGAH